MGKTNEAMSSHASPAQCEMKAPSLLQIYSTLPSPAPRPELAQNNPFVYEAMMELLRGNITGIRTELKPHQCRAAAMMVQRESIPTQSPDICADIPDTGESLSEPRSVDYAPGGILAEAIGCGKTLICLALIQATKHIPNPPPEVTDDVIMPRRRPKIASLMDMAAADFNRAAYPWKAGKGYVDPAYTNCMAALQRNPASYEQIVTSNELEEEQDIRIAGSREVQHSRRCFFTTTSLVIVPQLLMQQWEQEITKHTTDLHFLALRGPSSFTKLAAMHAEQLLQYDVILLSVEFIGELWQGAGCNGQDSKPILNSPLSMLRFKRCIVDEGHLKGISVRRHTHTNLWHCVESLQILSRWFVTGSPAPNMFGMDHIPLSELSSLQPSQSIVNVTRQEQNSQSVSYMLNHFVKDASWFVPWSEEGRFALDWTTYTNHPNNFDMAAKLQAKLSHYIIRHRVDDIEGILPEVASKVVRLDGCHQDYLCLNAFIMVYKLSRVPCLVRELGSLITIEDDAALFELIQNLRQATFFGGPFFYHDHMLYVNWKLQERQDHYRANSIVDDLDLATAIKTSHNVAFSYFRDLVAYWGEIPILVKDYPRERYRYPWHPWTRGPLLEANQDVLCTNWLLMYGARQRIEPSTTDADNMGEPSKTLVLWNEYLGNLNRRLQERINERRERKRDSGEEIDVYPVPLWEARMETLYNRRTTEKVGGLLTTSHDAPGEVDDCIFNARLTATASAKMSYLLDCILEHSETDKIVVYFEYELIAWQIDGLLLMLDIPHSLHLHKFADSENAANIASFQTDPEVRVMLMDLSEEVHGLDLSCASRVYFIHPLLNPEVEARAIGQVRRIGDKNHQKPIHVETLVLKHSIDEVVVQRREEMSLEEHRSCETYFDDDAVRAWIRDASYIPQEQLSQWSEMPEDESHMAQLKAPTPIFGRRIRRHL